MCPTQESQADMSAPSRLRLIDQLAISHAAAWCGILIYKGLFPGFYYLSGLGTVMTAWIVISVVQLLAVLTVRGASQGEEDARGYQLSSKYVVLMLLSTTGLLLIQAPLRASFLLARGGFEQALAEGGEAFENVRPYAYDFGLFHIGRAGRDCHKEDRVYFRFEDDGESAIIFSETGIDDLCYNSGNNGHLLGNWYWMKED